MPSIEGGDGGEGGGGGGGRVNVVDCYLDLRGAAVACLERDSRNFNFAFRVRSRYRRPF